MQHNQENIAYESVLKVHRYSFAMCCLWHVLSKRESLVSYLSKIFLKKEAMKFLQRGRLLHKREACGVKSKREIFLLEKLLFSNFIVLCHVVLPSIPKREIVGYN